MAGSGDTITVTLCPYSQDLSSNPPIPQPLMSEDIRMWAVQQISLIPPLPHCQEELREQIPMSTCSLSSHFNTVQWCHHHSDTLRVTTTMGSGSFSLLDFLCGHCSPDLASPKSALSLWIHRSLLQHNHLSHPWGSSVTRLSLAWPQPSSSCLLVKVSEVPRLFNFPICKGEDYGFLSQIDFSIGHCSKVTDTPSLYLLGNASVSQVSYTKLRTVRGGPSPGF